MLSPYDLGINLLEYGTYAGLYEGIVGMRVGETRRIVVLPSSVSTFFYVISSWYYFV
jgi:FKBP-type peptidyl-prolyl cis-trans isomerase